MRFQRTSQTLSDRADNIGLGLRLDAREDLLLDEDARVCNVTDARRLSRYHFEDLLRVQEGVRLVLYLRANKRGTKLVAPLLAIPFEGEGQPWSVAEAQCSAGSAGNITSIGGGRYLVVTATMLHARAHHDAIAGLLTLSQF